MFYVTVAFVVGDGWEQQDAEVLQLNPDKPGYSDTSTRNDSGVTTTIRVHMWRVPKFADAVSLRKKLAALPWVMKAHLREE